MKINYDFEKFDNFKTMLTSHNFKDYQGLTNKYKGFEIPNLTEDMKLKMLRKLNPSNRLETPSFIVFWDWYRKNLGMQTATLMSKYLYPSMGKEYQKLINTMRNNKNHEFWEHIKARVYKKWCSIITETQCVYALLSFTEKSNKNLDIISSAELDGVGIDFVLMFENSSVIPVQIKKISFSRIAMSKKNNDDNLSRFNINNRAMNLIKKEVEKVTDKYSVDSGVLVKYGLKNNNELPFPYLKEHDNGFIYFDGEELYKKMIEIINQN